MLGQRHMPGVMVLGSCLIKQVNLPTLDLSLLWTTECENFVSAKWDCLCEFG